VALHSSSTFNACSDFFAFLPNDFDTLAFTGHSHSMRTQTPKKDGADAMVFSSSNNNKRMLEATITTKQSQHE
jgi:hypothetical protein